MKKAVYFVACTIISGFTFAQTLESAKEKTAYERYDEATKDFTTLISKNPSSAENYFYLAENYLQSEKLDSASIYWNKAYETSPENALSLVAKGKVLWLKGNKGEAFAQFEAAIKASKKKNGEVFRQIGSILTEAPVKDLDKAISYLRTAVEVDPQNVEGYLLLGDAILEKDPKNGTDAIREYNNAEKIQQSPRTIVRKAKLYQRARNYKLADEMYVQAQTLDAKYAPAYKAHAELQGLFGKYDLAIENWKKYLALNDNNYARYKYAAALYSSQKYCDALKEAQDLKAKNYTSIYVERIDIYSTYECLESSADKNDPAKFEAGFKKINDFISKYSAKNEAIGMDYKYQAMYLSKLGKTDEAIAAYYKAAEDSTVAQEVLSGLAKTFTKAEKYDEAIKAYNKIIEKDSNALSLADYFELGRIYFLAKDYANSDKANAHVLKLSPTYSFSHFWRGRANVYMDLDKTTWAAKPHYEGYLNNTSDEQKIQYKNMTLEAYKYLGDYYINSPEKNIEKAKEIWTKIIELEPENESNKKILDKLNK
ncbi:MAG: tetratricopeptide repeat protein [Flavobacteriia bacterium]|nr:tetratricopeptide repeat protein [Flavobacteriia bacterium]OJX39817.1 MAG: hypothetical protein BGO87_02340 [Flavobacteriia bacterium 40-80]